MELEFVKMHGIGNDFIMLDDRNRLIQSHISYSTLAEKLCDRRFGIGGDGLILAVPSQDHDIGFRIFNSDGTEPEMCGNGMRCFAKYLFERQIITTPTMRVETLAGTIIPEVILDSGQQVTSVRVDMGEPVLEAGKVPFVSDMDIALMDKLYLEDQVLSVTAVSMGNPHAVIFVDQVDQVDIAAVGRQVEVHSRFPEKTNVEFVQVISDSELDMRVWERGAGITLACGTGACATLVAAHLNKLTSHKALIHLAGGDLEIEWNRENNHLYKTGPAEESFSGRVRV
ncbi:MAG: diaminopimelate epimerase [Desulfobacteraceae bacterium]|nr:MAG: diaminopimelate epimerase [Desulfobacteraceae bacterium]